MTTAALKKKIKALVDKEVSEKKLVRVYDALATESKDEAMRRGMQEAVEASERDFKAGRALSLKEFENDTDAFLERLLVRKSSTKTAASRKAKASKAPVRAKRTLKA